MRKKQVFAALAPAEVVAVATAVKYARWWLKYFSMRGMTTLVKNFTSLLDFLKSFLLLTTLLNVFASTLDILPTD